MTQNPENEYGDSRGSAVPGNQRHGGLLGLSRGLYYLGAGNDAV